VFTVVYKENSWEVNREFFKENVPVYSIFESGEYVWLGSDTKAYRIKLSKEFEPVEVNSYYFLEEFSEKVIVTGLGNKPYFLLSTGIYGFDTEMDELVSIDTLQDRKQQFYQYVFAGDGQTWIYSSSLMM
ncbi:unnamed protein product, partial [marine sediment metagenome]